MKIAHKRVVISFLLLFILSQSTIADAMRALGRTLARSTSYRVPVSTFSSKTPLIPKIKFSNYSRFNSATLRFGARNLLAAGTVAVAGSLLYNNIAYNNGVQNTMPQESSSDLLATEAFNRYTALETSQNINSKLHRDLTIIIDFNEITNRAAPTSLHAALKSEIAPILFNKSPILRSELSHYFSLQCEPGFPGNHIIWPQSIPKECHSDHNWRFYEDEHFILMIPQNYLQAHKDFGFNIHGFRQTSLRSAIGKIEDSNTDGKYYREVQRGKLTPWQAIVKEYEDPKNIIALMNEPVYQFRYNDSLNGKSDHYFIACLEKLLQRRDKAGMEFLWNIVLVGHGDQVGQVVAGLSSSACKQFHLILNTKIKTNALLLQSCYLQTPYLSSKLYEGEQYNFVSINEGFKSSATSSSDTFDYNNLYEVLHSFNCDMCCWKNKLAEGINQITTVSKGKTRNIENIVSVRSRNSDIFSIPTCPGFVKRYRDESSLTINTPLFIVEQHTITSPLIFNNRETVIFLHPSLNSTTYNFRQIIVPQINNLAHHFNRKKCFFSENETDFNELDKTVLIDNLSEISSGNSNKNTLSHVIIYMPSANRSGSIIAINNNSEVIEMQYASGIFTHATISPEQQIKNYLKLKSDHVFTTTGVKMADSTIANTEKNLQIRKQIFKFMGASAVAAGFVVAGLMLKNNK